MLQLLYRLQLSKRGTKEVMILIFPDINEGCDSRNQQLISTNRRLLLTVNLLLIKLIEDDALLISKSGQSYQEKKEEKMKRQVPGHTFPTPPFLSTHAELLRLLLLLMVSARSFYSEVAVAFCNTYLLLTF
jgi:hypothetical protein